MTLRMSQVYGNGMNDWLELSGVRGVNDWMELSGLGGQAEDLAEIQAEKAQVQAEIARLKGGGAPVAGGFRPAPLRAPAPLSPARPVWPRVVGGVVVLGLGAFLLSRVMRRRR